MSDMRRAFEVFVGWFGGSIVIVALFGPAEHGSGLFYGVGILAVGFVIGLSHAVHVVGNRIRKRRREREMG